MQDEKMKKVQDYYLNREFLEKIAVAMNHVTKPYMVEFGKKMRVVIDYDPDKEQVHFAFFITDEQTRDE